MNAPLSIALAFGALLLSAALQPAEGPPWDEILGTSRGSRPAPQAEVAWRSDLRGALEEARASGRPLFVTLRCLPCKQCADFDKDVLEGGPRLDPLPGPWPRSVLPTATSPPVPRPRWCSDGRAPSGMTRRC